MTENKNRSPVSEQGSSTETKETTVGTSDSFVPSSRRRVLQALGGGAAALAFAGGVSADDHGDVEYSSDENERPEGDVSYIRMSDQVTDGTYCVVDELNIVPEEGAFAEIHLGTPLKQIDSADEEAFINTKDGGPQFAFETTLGFSTYLEQGYHENVTVPLFDDEELLAIDGSLDRLPQPAVVVALLHIDSNDNQQFDNYRPGDPDPAFGDQIGDLDQEEIGDIEGDEVGEPNDLNYAPPSARTTDIAALVPLKKNAEDFKLFRPRTDDNDKNGKDDKDKNDHDGKNDKDDHDDDKDDHNDNKNDKDDHNDNKNDKDDHNNNGKDDKDKRNGKDHEDNDDKDGKNDKNDHNEKDDKDRKNGKEHKNDNDRRNGENDKDNNDY